MNTVTRETHSFDQRLMHMMHIWYPDRSEDSIRDAINGFYMRIIKNGAYQESQTWCKNHNELIVSKAIMSNEAEDAEREEISKEKQMKDQPKIVQISSVVEYTEIGGNMFPSSEATIYALGEDQKMYYWGRTKSTKIDYEEPNDEGDTYYYEHEWGWKIYEP